MVKVYGRVEVYLDQHKMEANDQLHCPSRFTVGERFCSTNRITKRGGAQNEIQNLETITLRMFHFALP